jgi:hypothetical protein
MAALGARARKEDAPSSLRHLAYFAAEAYRALYGGHALDRARELEAGLRRTGQDDRADILLGVIVAIGATQANSSTALN